MPEYIRKRIPMSKKNASNLTTAYISSLSDSFTALRDSICNAFSPLMTPEYMYASLDALSDSANELASVLAHSVLENFDYDILRDSCHRLVTHLSVLSLTTYDFHSLFNNITLNDDYVSITDDAAESIIDFFKEQEEPIPNISSRMFIKDFFLVILLPLICTILPMIQNSHYQKLNAIEAQKNQLQESEYREAILNLETQHAKELEEINSNINELLQYLESVQDTDLSDTDVQSLLSDVQEKAVDSFPAEVEADDVSGNHDMNQSLY